MNLVFPNLMCSYSLACEMQSTCELNKSCMLLWYSQYCLKMDQKWIFQVANKNNPLMQTCLIERLFLDCLQILNMKCMYMEKKCKYVLRNLQALVFIFKKPRDNHNLDSNFNKLNVCVPHFKLLYIVKYVFNLYLRSIRMSKCWQ